MRRRDRRRRRGRPRHRDLRAPRQPRRSVVLLDGAQSPGAKILVSGGSRCNVTNATVTERDFWGGTPSVIRRVLRAFPVERHGRVLPRDRRQPARRSRRQAVPRHQSRARRARRAAARERRAGATLVRDIASRTCRVLDVAPRTPTPHGDSRRHDRPRRRCGASAVVLATGGQSLPKSGSDGAGFAIAERLGHTIVPTTPALAPLLLDATDRVHAERFRRVAGRRARGAGSTARSATRLTGSLLWTHFGISGPVALNASRHWLRAQLEGRAVAHHRELPSRRTFDDGRRRLAATRRREARRRRCSPRSRRCCRRRSPPRSCDSSRSTATATLAHFARDDRRAPVARAGRVAAAGHRLARLHLRRGDGRRRGAHRNRPGDDGSRGCAPGSVVRRRNPRRRRPDRRLQFPVGLVERVRRRPRARARI